MIQLNPFRFLIIGALIWGCSPNPGSEGDKGEYIATAESEWIKEAVIYEVNIRQFTPEGTFQAFERHLPRLKELGVDVLLLMPIHPIGQEQRMGTIGAPDAIQSHVAINPEFGDQADLQHLVTSIHKQGMKVVMDWVGHYTARDHELTNTIPNGYLQDEQGQFISPAGSSRSDVIVLDYENEAVRKYMNEAMQYWVQSFDVDGFQFDTADTIPEYWTSVRNSLNQIKPVFLLSRRDELNTQDVFDATYAWELEATMNAVFSGTADANQITKYVRQKEGNKSLAVLYTTNYLKNAQEGTVFERFGKAAEMFAVMTYALEGIPMIYSGQEVGLNRSLSLYEKDSITWRDHPFNALYARLNHLHKTNPALWSGNGSEIRSLDTDKPGQVLAIYRKQEKNCVLAIFNCSGESTEFQLNEDRHVGPYKQFKSRSNVVLSANEKFVLGPWSYELYIAR